MASVTFTSRRSPPELVPPARATPRETKALSDIDNQPSLRFYATGVDFFRAYRGAQEEVVDAAKAVKAALAEALVHYYPVAGRLRELPGSRRLVLDCTGQGVVFVEANASVRLEELGEPLTPPYPCVEEFLCDPQGDMYVVVGKPLCFMQVTRLQCGGFVLGVHVCHSICDAFGVSQFIKAIADLARGETLPCVLPVWERELLSASSLPAPGVTLEHSEYEPLPDGDDAMRSTPPDGMVGSYFFFGPGEIAALRRQVESPSTVFELLAAVTWRCRTAALAYGLEQRVRLMFTANTRRRRWSRELALPRGYYGCTLAFPIAEATAGELCERPLGYAVQLVREAKLGVTEEFMRPTVHVLARRAWPSLVVDRTYLVSDVAGIGEEESPEFGWAEHVGGGVPMASDIPSKMASYFMRCKDADGEECVAVPMYLPAVAMDRYSSLIAACSKK